MDSRHVLARRDIRGEKSNLKSEAYLMGLAVVGGVTAVQTESLWLTLAIFGGGLGAWFALSLPDTIAALKKSASEDAAAKLAAIKERAQLNAQANDKQPVPSTRPLIPDAELTLNLMKARRSIFPKDFTGAKVARADVEKLLEATNWAPTHHLTQPWRFVVLEGESKSKFEGITIDCVGKYSPADKAADAVERLRGKAAKAWPLVSHYVVICMASVPANKDGKPNPEWEDLASVGCAVQNLALQACSMGIAGYWSSWQAVARNAPEMKEFLKLDAGSTCYGVFSLGYSDRADSYRGSRKPIMDKVAWMS